MHLHSPMSAHVAKPQEYVLNEPYRGVSALPTLVNTAQVDIFKGEFLRRYCHCYSLD